MNFLDGRCPRRLRKELPNSTWISVPAPWDGEEPQRSWVSTIDHLGMKIRWCKITLFKNQDMGWWKGILKNKRKARKEAGTLFSTRQVHLPKTTFGLTSSSCKRSKIVRFVRLHHPNEPQCPPIEAAERPELVGQGEVVLNFKKDKVPEKYYPGTCASAWDQPSNSMGSGSPFLPPSCSLVPSSPWPPLTSDLIIWWPNSGSPSWVMPLRPAALVTETRGSELRGAGHLI